MTLPDLPPHTCYVEVWPTYQRLFRKPPSPVEVCNDHGVTAQLFRLLREQPQTLLMAVTSDEENQERSCYQQLLTDWQYQQADRASIAFILFSSSTGYFQWTILFCPKRSINQ